MTEDRIEKIESKIALLEDSVQILNDTVYQQQKTFDRMELLLSQLVSQVRDLAQSAEDRGTDEPPPHY